MNRRQKILNLIIPIIPVLCIILLWSIISKSIDNSYLLPSLKDTLSKFFTLFTYSEFYYAVLGTVIRSFVSFIISFILAFLFAYFSVKYKYFEKAIQPIVAIIRVLPTIAVVLILLVWTNSQIAPIVVTMLVVLPTTFTSVKNAFENVDSDQIEMCKAFKVSEKDILFKVKIPQITPYMLICIGSGLSLNLKLMVAAEVLSYTSKSLGNYLYIANLYDETVTMFALVLVTVILGLIIEITFNLISKKARRWQ